MRKSLFQREIREVKDSLEYLYSISDNTLLSNALKVIYSHIQEIEKEVLR
jgi:hypothetical protein